MLVGPDNGLLWPAIERLGGAVEAVDVSLSRVSAGADLGDLPRPRRVRPGRRPPGPRRGARRGGGGDRRRLAGPARGAGAGDRGGRVIAHVVSRRPVRERGARPRRPPPARDRAAAGPPAHGRGRGATHDAVFALTFADVPDGGLILYEDSNRQPRLAVNRGDAAARSGPRARRPRSSCARPTERWTSGSAASGPRAATSGSPTRPTSARASSRPRGRRAARSSPPPSRPPAAAAAAARGRAPAGKAVLCSAILSPLERSSTRCSRSPSRSPSARRSSRSRRSSAGSSGRTTSGVDERKLGGVLIEAQPPDWAVIGIGLNVSIEPDEFPATCASPRPRWATAWAPRRRSRRSVRGLGEWVDADRERVLGRVRRRATRSAGGEIGWVGAGGAG